MKGYKLASAPILMGWGKVIISIILVAKLMSGIAVSQQTRPHVAIPERSVSGLSLKIPEPKIPILRYGDDEICFDGVIRGQEIPLFVSSLKGAASALGKYHLPGWEGLNHLDSAKIYLLYTLGTEYFSRYPAEIHNLGFLHEGDITTFSDYLLPEIEAFLEERAEETGIAQRHAMFAKVTGNALERITRSVELTASGNLGLPERGGITRGVIGGERTGDYFFSYEETSNGLHQIQVDSYAPWMIYQVMNSLSRGEQRGLIETIRDLRSIGHRLTIQAGEIKLIFDRIYFQIVLGDYDCNFQNSQDFQPY